MVLLGAALVALFSTASRAEPLTEKLKALPFKIAFESYVNGHSDVYIMNADGSNKQNITHETDGQAHYPQVSPDGTKICFTIDSGEGRDTVRTVWLMDLDGTNRRKIADHAREPFWSPDGKIIGYLPQEYPKFDVIDFFTKGMMFYDLATGEAKPHPNSQNLRHLYHPRFAPNGQWIVSSCHAGMGFQHAILAIEAHGDKFYNLEIPGCRPTISPDGSHIAWGSTDQELSTAPIDFSGDHPVVGKPDLQIREPDKHVKIYHIAWSPDGKFVAFSRGPDGDGDLSKTGSFRSACEIIGVYATDWNLYAASLEHRGVIDLGNSTDVAQLTTSGMSNKEAFWFRPAK